MLAVFLLLMLWTEKSKLCVRYPVYAYPIYMPSCGLGQTDGLTDTQHIGGHNIISRHFLCRGIKMIFTGSFISCLTVFNYMHLNSGKTRS